MEKTQTKQNGFYRSLFALVLPIAVQNLISTAVSSADVVMVGYVGQDALSAVSLVNQVMFILQLVYAGISSGSTMLAAQYWGKKDPAIICKFGAWRRCYFIVQAADDAYGGSDTYRNRLSDGHDLY